MTDPPSDSVGTSDGHVDKARESDLAGAGAPARRKPASCPSPACENPFADGSEDPLAVPVDLVRDGEAGEGERDRDEALSGQKPA